MGRMATIEEGVFLRQLEKNTMLNSISLRGVKGIRSVFLIQQDSTDDGSIRVEKGKEWVLEMASTSRRPAMCIDGVDFTRTYSNSCMEIFNVLGIEAARAAIMMELRGVIQVELDGSYVNYRHLVLLCDLMIQ